MSAKHSFTISLGRRFQPPSASGLATALDGTVDGVIDNLPACLRRFDPSSYVFSDTHQSLQCTGPKTDSCLSKAQIEAVENINEGPRNVRQQRIKAPAGTVAHD